jgi:hypothetical protein
LMTVQLRPHPPHAALLLTSLPDALLLRSARRERAHGAVTPCVQSAVEHQRKPPHTRDKSWVECFADKRRLGQANLEPPSSSLALVARIASHVQPMRADKKQYQERVAANSWGCVAVCVCVCSCGCAYVCDVVCVCWMTRQVSAHSVNHASHNTRESAVGMDAVSRVEHSIDHITQCRVVSSFVAS